VSMIDPTEGVEIITSVQRLTSSVVPEARSIRLERETPDYLCNCLRRNRPSAATAAAATVFLTPCHFERFLENLGLKCLLAW
jgi:hypothetical protein